MGKTEHCRTEATDFEINDSIQQSGKLSPLGKSINVPSFRVGDALGLFTPYLNDVFLAAQILRGKNIVFFCLPTVRFAEFGKTLKICIELSERQY